MPNHLRTYPDLRDFTDELGDAGLSLSDFSTNGMFLPSTEAIACRWRLPLHRGSHQTYNAVVIDALDAIRCGAIGANVGPEGRLAAIRNLQANLRVQLHVSAMDAEVVLASRDPFGNGAAAAIMDRKTDALFFESLSAGTNMSKDFVVLDALGLEPRTR